ncbi:MAG TPA: hypothetical protein VJW76_13580, partial [Verrucomicrobiae bacterium]|nr:hypothetical protein [Verrucomicrobiae bacterium]
MEGRIQWRSLVDRFPVLVITLILALVGSEPARGATQVLFEGFEGAFPGSWSVGDANGVGTAAFWDDVDSAFGGEGTHTGNWKGYCAGTGFAGTTASPIYQSNMQAFMQRSVDLTPFTSGQLTFWLKLPSIEPCCDSCRVFVDGTLVWTNGGISSAWGQAVVPLDAFVGGVRTIRFEFVSDTSVALEGWYLDDIEVTGVLPPPNDPFASAQTIVGNSGSLTSVTTDATKEPGEPDHAGNAGGASVWYQWTTTQNGVVTFNTFGTAFDTLLAVYTGTGVNNLVPVASNDDFAPPGNRASSVTFQAAAGRTYRIAVDGFGGANGGFRLNWQFVTVTETILATSITNYTTLVIDSDAGNPNPGYDREAIRIKSEVRSVNTSPVDHFTSYELRYRLLGPGDVPHPIFDSTGVTNSNFSFNLTNTLAIPSGGTVTNTGSVAILPAARLNPFVQYRVELQIHRYGNFTGQSFTDAGKGYYHFTNLVSGDPALNVIAQETLTAWNRIYAVKTAPGKGQFLVDANYALLRYDNFTSLIAPASVPVTLNYQLIDASDGSIIPLKQNQAGFTESMPSFAFAPSGIAVPAIQFFTRNLPVEPVDGVQLDPVNKLYRVAVTVSHVDQTGQPPAAGNTLAGVDQRLLHFNGHLFFGLIDTIFTSIANDPPITGVTPTFVRSVLAIDNNSGSVVGVPNHVYGDGTALSVILRANGNAELTSGNVILTLNPPGPDLGNAAGVNFLRGPITLSATGGAADFLVQLPAGLGYTTDITQKYLESAGLFPGVSLNQSLLPASNPVFAAPIWICEETKPIWIEVNSTTWEVGGGRFVMTPTSATAYVRQQELAALESAPVPDDAKIKRSNEQYFRSVFRVVSPQVIAEAGPGGSARLTAEITFGPGQFHAHFPYDALIRWTADGSMNISNDVVAAAGSQLSGVEPIELAYNRDCLGMECPSPGIGPVTNGFDVSGELKFTSDGGLAAQGALISPVPLAWGYIQDSGRYAHRTEPVQSGGFLMAGIFLAGTEPADTDEDRAGTILLTGVSPSNPAASERPQNETAYEEGLGDYPGLNFRVTQHPGLKGESTLGAQASGLYDLKSGSKYYVRWGGVNGIHEAVSGSFSDQLTIYGYPLNFSNFGLSFLDSENEESRTEGYVDLPFPADITNNFQELKFTCLGDLGEMKIPKAEAGQYKLLSYWNADFVTLGIKFDRKQAELCSPGTGFLVLAMKAHATHVDQALYGEVGFNPNGNIISRFDNKLDDFDSRLKLPATFKLKGPAQEKYTVTPVADAYFNTHGLPGAPSQGFVSIIGKMDVPFFEDLKVHIHTQGKTNGVATAGLPVRLAGGWPDKGFRDTAGDHFFTVKNFDAPNAGFPASGFGFGNPVSNAVYEENASSEEYHPRAMRTWLEVVDFDYPLTWNGVSRSFNSFTQVVDNLLILEAENQVKYLSAENAELVFGIQYDGLPTFNIANLAFEAVDQKTGAIQAFVDAGLGAARQQITDALTGMDALLDTDLHKFLKAPFDDRIQPVVSGLYDDLKSTYGANPVNWKAAAAATNELYFTSTAQNHFRTRFRNIMGTPGVDQGILTQLTNDLTSLHGAIGQVRLIITNTPLVANLAKELVNQLASKLAGSVADTKLLEALKKSQASVKEIDFTLGELQKAVAELRNRITDASNGDLRKELLAAVQSAQGEAATLAFLNLAKADVLAYVASINDSVGNPFQTIKR